MEHEIHSCVFANGFESEFGYTSIIAMYMEVVFH